eukprot:5195458-Prymnesium_polylepis.1
MSLVIACNTAATWALRLECGLQPHVPGPYWPEKAATARVGGIGVIATGAELRDHYFCETQIAFFVNRPGIEGSVAVIKP